jgi:hypothetical protein
MTESSRDRWERARQDLIRRWRQILEKIEERDESGVLELASVMDEFCDEAMTDRGRTSAGEPNAAAGQKPPSAKDVPAIRCTFCRGFMENSEGCLGLLAELNQAIFAKRWERAGELARGWIEGLQAMDLSDVEGNVVH